MIDSSGMDCSSAEFFERKYRERADPWDFGGSAYELERYGATMRALAGRRFRHGFEPGCSIGVLTERLAEVCDQLDALEFSSTAAEAARVRCAGLKQVRVWTGSLEDPLPATGFDLIVLSEIGYYFDVGGLERCADALLEGLVQGGWLLAVHWLGQSDDHRLSGDEVHAVLRSRAGVRLEVAERHAGFRLDRWTKR